VVGRLRTAGLGNEDAQRLIATAADQQAGRAALAEQLARVGVDEPTMKAAQQVLVLLEQQTGKYIVDASQAKGLIIGDHGEQHNTFS